MKIPQSLLFRLLSVIAGAFLLTALIVLYFSEKKLVEIVDQEQQLIYSEKLTAVIKRLELNDEKLFQTGIVEAYKQGFQDMALQSLRSIYYHTNQSPDYLVIVNYRGGIVLHPTLPAGDMSVAGEEVIRKAIAMEHGSLDYVYREGEEKWCVFRRFPSWEWVVLFSVPKEYKYREVIQFKREISGLLIFICALVLAVISMLLYHVIKPIIKLSKASRAIAEGDLQIELKNERNDEVGELTRNFMRMQDAVKKQLTDSAQQNVELKDEIKQRKQATAALIESEHRYREIFNTPTDAIFLINANTGNIADVNVGMQEMFGCTYAEALQLEVKNLIPDTSPYSFRDGQRKVKRVINEGPQTFEWQGKKSTGEIFWIEISLKLIEFSGIRYLLAVARDIDERKVAVQALEEEQERLAVTLRSIGDGVISTDEYGKVVLLNNAGEKLTGWEQSSARGNHFSEIFTRDDTDGVGPEQSPIIEQLIAGTPIQMDKIVLVNVQDLGKRSVALSGAPILDRDKKVYGAVIVFRDITDFLKIEAEMLKVKKLESIGILAGGLAHDFNNIIFGIQGNISLALTTIDQHSNVGRYLKAADKATERAADLTQQLLTFSKGGEPVKRIITLKGLPEEAARLVLGESKIELSCSYERDLLAVEADSNQISQVIQNIVTNAVQSMDCEGSIAITCENYVQVDPADFMLNPGQYVQITIKDQGNGIPAEDLDKIFDPYFSTKRTGQGLGLAICHSVVKNHGGVIVVHSVIGQGTTFYLYLPAVEPLPEHAAVTDIQSGDAVEQKKTVLIMDDEKMIRDLVTEILKREGYSISTAKAGEEAIEIYQKMLEESSPPDVVIMDLTIPGGMGGKEAARAIKNLHLDARLIVSSGYSNDPVLAHFQEHGFCEVLTKPYRREDLCRCVERAILTR